MERVQDDRKVAFVTGAARGLGQAIAHALARDGFDLFLVDILNDELAGTADHVVELGGRCEFLTAELGSRSVCIEAVADCLRRYGRLDVLCNAAGIMRMRHAADVTEQEWERIVAVNLSAPFWLCQAAMPELILRCGNIVNVASVAAQRGAAYLAPYAATKAGLVQMTKSLAVEFEDDPVRINVVAPGSMATSMNLDSRPPEGSDQRKLQRLTGTRPTMAAEEVAEVVAFVASPRATALHGAVVFADSGTTAG